MFNACALVWVSLGAAVPPQGEVTMPLSVYEELVNNAGPGDVEAVPPPARSSVREATYAVTADGALARVRMTALVDVLERAANGARKSIPRGVDGAHSRPRSRIRRR